MKPTIMDLLMSADISYFHHNGIMPILLKEGLRLCVMAKTVSTLTTTATNCQLTMRVLLICLLVKVWTFYNECISNLHILLRLPSKMKSTD